MGPGTKIVDRLNKNIKPKSYADKVSLKHDIDYTTAKNKNDIRKADEKMLSSLKNDLSIFHPL